MTVVKRLEGLARKGLTPGMARAAKRLVVGPRYAAQAAACRKGFKEFGSRYPQPVLFVAGLPKSGTTWLERMISSWPGFHELLIPDVAGHELRTGGSHDYDLPTHTFSRMREMLVLSKMHVHGSETNVRVLRDSGVRYAVLFRDLRDVAVSNAFYVRNTPWHPEHPFYAGKSTAECLAVFAERTLGPYTDWVRSWDKNRDPNASVVLRYEQLLADAPGCLKRVAELFELPASNEELAGIVDRNSFESMSGGRERGKGDGSQFIRKGVAGDWVNHFDDRLKDLYKERIGGFLIEYGYEENTAW